MVVWGLIQVQVVVVCGGAVWHRTRDSDGLWSAGWRPFGGDLPLDDEGDVIRVETHSLVSTSALAEGALSRALYVRAEGGDETYKISCMDPEVHVVEEHSIMTDGSVRVNEGGKPTPGSTFDPLFPWGVWVYYGTTGQGSFRQPEFYDVF
ncbi:hypothetical protein Micbo1qcDRAFT_168854 [Microdochium bolleyi]|uniref:Uncharacterized protein n=1 Tax=Microdochium bolleyi TaxID=196109 RepID=A0A136IMG8_9PEZI|nr:hypothetical protein Micbo1qcDRAFT_168854 [Microdochium bolleyi]